MADRLEVICLEENEVETLSDLEDLQRLPSLRRLLLSRNRIKTVYSDPSSKATKPLSFPQVTYLDLSRNEVADWTFLDDLRATFPNLVGVRTSQNPLYGSGDSKTLSEEAFQLTIARLDPKITSLNYSIVRRPWYLAIVESTPTDKRNR
ncbi:hypothetical protein ABW19_dt0200527 [Dactylella cylindrospora]|nr:hypothetical protein ABW19_dt0200527 [Dactylella cylindrospora]